MQKKRKTYCLLLFFVGIISYLIYIYRPIGQNDVVGFYYGTYCYGHDDTNVRLCL